MSHLLKYFVVGLSLLVSLQAGCVYSQGSSFGIFEANSDIGDVRKPGYVKYDASQETYLVAGGGGEIQVLAKLFGGQGTINVPSWSPDSKNLAFVSYRLINPENK